MNPKDLTELAHLSARDYALITSDFYSILYLLTLSQLEDPHVVAVLRGSHHLNAPPLGVTRGARTAIGRAASEMSDPRVEAAIEFTLVRVVARRPEAARRRTVQTGRDVDLEPRSPILEGPPRVQPAASSMEGGAARAAWLAGGAVQEGVQSRPEYMLGGIAGHEPKEIWRAVAARIPAALMVAAPRTKGCVVADIRSAEDDAIKALP